MAKTKEKIAGLSSIIKDSIEYSNNAFSEKKQIFIEYDRRYARSASEQVNPNNPQITTNALYTAVQTLLAQNNVDRLRPEFVPVGSSPTNREKSNILELIAKNDEEIGRYQEQFEQSDKDVVFYGAGVLHFYGYDHKRNLPLICRISPYSLILDPEGGPDIETHRYFGCRMKYNISDLRNDESIDQKELDKLIQEGNAKSEDYIYQYDLFLSQWSGYSTSPDSDGLETNNEMLKKAKINKRAGFIYLTHLYFYNVNEKGEIKKYETISSSDGEHIIKCRELEAATSEERANAAKIPYPFVAEQFSWTNELDFFGLNIFSIAASNAQVSSTLMNHAKDLIDKNLQAPTFYKEGKLSADDNIYGKNRLIGVKGTNDVTPVTDYVSPAPTQNVNMGDVLSAVEKIERLNERPLGISDRTLGVSEDPNVDTLGQAKILSSNALRLTRKRSSDRSRARERFYEIWMREKYLNFRDSEKSKSVMMEVGSGISSMQIKIDKKTFEKSIVSKINVKSTLAERDDGAQKNQALLSLLPAVSQQSHPLTLRAYTREIIKNTGLFADTKEVLPELPEERALNRIRTLLELDDEVMLEKVSPDVSPVIQLMFVGDIPTSVGRSYAIMLRTAVSRMNSDMVKEETAGDPTQAEQKSGEIAADTKPVAQGQSGGFAPSVPA